MIKSNENLDPNVFEFLHLAITTIKISNGENSFFLVLNQTA